ncbi:cyclic nucleotide-binding domain-containing protein [Nocardioides panacis]|uniref:Cyclic nucleotide-binding domain-containing protein n=1 Tax=Nocardioides panacis TaxID=2849501 RepID=A0A975XZY4_9ACTN|nr:ATP-binding protein [Nocardioides panacis]QWZ07883.1 cyclic nucleotide-binding domain-containing protein [Nocardioides panacis]
MRVADLRPLPLFDGLDDDRLAELLAGGAEVGVAPGAVLFREGEPADSWWVLVDGALELVKVIGREETVVARMDVPGRWAGGFRAWDDQGVYLATGRGVAPGRVLCVPSAVLRRLSDAWFPFGGHLIEGVYRTARSIESTARQRGALLTLGTLAAGLAHEINNPAAAATRAADALGTTCDTLLSSLGRLAHDEISPGQFAALDALRLEVVPAVVAPPGSAPAAVDPLALADREQELSAWLSRRGVADGWTLAAPLAAAGVDVAWCDRVAAVVEGPALEPALRWAASTFEAATLLGEVRESTRRISELVGAVRSYSQMDRASRQRIRVTDGLESTLVMLSHKLRPGVAVVREYADDVPMIEAYPGELNQVWTNLVDNAVDAMGGSGTLRVSTRLDDGSVVVEVGDTGTGMTPQVAARAFEAFYTTKDVDAGTGLGLDIARRIVVERHHGEISVDSRPGDTVMRVRLPVDLPPD